MPKIFALIILVVIIALLATGILWWVSEMGGGAPVEDVAAPVLTDFTYDSAQREFIAMSENLNAVEVWSVPTGTGITKADHALVGAMDRENEENGLQTWKLEVPKYPLSVTEIYAIGYDDDGNEVGQISWTVQGATEIYNMLWLQIPFEEATLSIGESFTVDTLNLKLVDIPEDSRCPIGVQCIQAGHVTADIEVTLDGKTTLSSIKSDAGERKFGEYYISLVKVEPVPHEGETILATEYELTFYISKDISKL